MKKIFGKMGVAILPAMILLCGFCELAGAAAAGELPANPLPGYVVQEAEYRGVIEDALAVFSIRYQIEVLGKNAVRVPLFSDAWAVMRAQLPRGVLLVPQNGWCTVLLPGKGRYVFSLQASSPIARKDDRNVLSLNVNPASLSRLSLTVPGADLDIQSAPALSSQVQNRGKTTEFTAYLGTANAVELSWFAKASSMANAKLLYHAEHSALVTVLPGAIRSRLFVTYKILQGKLSRATLSLPASLNILAVKAEALRAWDVKKDREKQVLTIELSREVSEQYHLVIDAEEIKESTAGSYAIPAVDCAGADRQSGFAAIVLKDDVKVREVRREGGAQLDATELPDMLQREAGGAANIALGYRFVRFPNQLVLMLEKIKPEINVRNNLYVDLTPERMKLLLNADYSIKKAGVYTFSVAVPPDMEITDVQGENIEHWEVAGAGPAARLEVQLRSKAIGAYALRISLEKMLENVFQDISVPMVSAVNTDKLITYIAISADPSLRLKKKQRNHLTEAGLDELRPAPLPLSSAPMLAYKGNMETYDLQVSVERVDTRVMADVFSFISVADGLLLMNSAVDFTILFAGTDQFTLAFPAGVQAVDITGDGIKAKDEKTEETMLNGKKVNRIVYTVTLHSKVKGKYTLYASYEQPFPDSQSRVQVPSLAVGGVDRQTGTVAIGPRTNAQIEIGELEAISQMDVKELPPEKVGGIDIPLLYALKYTRAPYAFSLDIKKHDDVSVLVAVVESAQLTTVFNKDGQQIIRAQYRIKNRSKQYLDFMLPKDASLWSTFVDGKAVKPSQTKEGKILLPLPKSEEKDRSFMVELIYETKSAKFWWLGRLSLAAPQLDIPQTNVVWQVFLPEVYHYFGFSGTMERGMRPLPLPQKPDLLTRSINVVGSAQRDGLNEPMAPSVMDAQEMPGRLRVKREMHRGQNAAAVQSMRGEEDYQTLAQGDAGKDMEFMSNVSGQVARYSQKVAVSSESKAVTKGKQKGVLPIYIDIPAGGKRYDFYKLFSREPLTIR
ncbi:MAG: hypothetical protein NC924_08290, partial [Candidatus Omnitrophica bacterium]|nr:hypothetical protein [Candidatus Omnitrophota bacterium]